MVTQKLEIQTKRVPGIGWWKADLFPMRRTVANQTQVRPSYQLQVFSHQHFNLARRLLSFTW